MFHLMPAGIISPLSFQRFMINNMDCQKLVACALELGFNAAEIIPTYDIVLSEEFRKTCADNRCGLYNKCWMCPPDVGEIDVLMKEVKSYSFGLLYQSIVELEDSFDIEGMTNGGYKHSMCGRELAKKLLPQLPNRTLHLNCGGCRFCKRCAKQDGKPCRAPDNALSSLEAYGIDVYQTVKKTKLKYVNGTNTVTYFGMILF